MSDHKSSETAEHHKKEIRELTIDTLALAGLLRAINEFDTHENEFNDAVALTQLLEGIGTVGKVIQEKVLGIEDHHGKLAAIREVDVN